MVRWIGCAHVEVLGRVLVAVVLVLALVGGASVAAADGHSNGRACPGGEDGNPTRAYEHVSDRGYDASLFGRINALTNVGCTLPDDTSH